MAIIVANDGSQFVATIAERNGLTKRFNGLLVTVKDVTADPQFGGGSAQYMWDADTGRWQPVWAERQPELRFVTEERTIVDGQVTASHAIKDQRVWSAYVLNANREIIATVHPSVAGKTLTVEGSQYNGQLLRFTYAYGTIELDLADLLAEKADRHSPAFSGIPTAPTAAAGSNSTQVATTAFVSAYTIPYTTAEKSKLSGIATGATKNDTDANLKNRANHTGTQAIDTVVGLQAALDEAVKEGDARLTNARDWTASTVSQAEAETGTATTTRKWTAQRVRQAAQAAYTLFADNDARILNGQAAYTWGDHALAGYVKTDTKYSAGAGLTLSDTTFSLPITTAGTGTFVTSVTQTANGLTVNLGTPPNTNTTYAEIPEAEVTAGTASTLRTISARRLKQAVDDHGLKVGTAAGTAAAGNDSRIVNGQTAYGWGNHATAGYVKTNTTYTAGAGLTLTGTAFSLPVTISGSGSFVSSVVQTANGITVTLGTPPDTNTTYAEIAEAEITTGTASTARAISARRLKFAVDTHGLKLGTSGTTAAAGNDARLSDSREWTAATVSQAEAEAGTATTRRAWTAQRVRQAAVAGVFGTGNAQVRNNQQLDARYWSKSNLLFELNGTELTITVV